MPALLLAALLLARPADAGPAMVTAISGTVSLGTAAAPTVPFLVPEGSVLQLAQGASAVVLVGGQARRVEGPARIDPQSLAEAEAQSAAAIDSLLARRVEAGRAGATRAHGGPTLLRPVPGATALAVDRVTWTCDAPCAEVEVELQPLLGEGPAWQGRGSGQVQVGDLALEPGPWVVRLDGVEHGFLVADGAALGPELGAGDQAAEALSADDRVGRASVRAAVRWQAGLATDALVVLDDALAATPDDPALATLRAGYEAQVGLSR